MNFSENTLNAYAAPLSDSENTKCLRTIKEIRDALKGLGYTDDGKDIALLESDTLAYAVSLRNKYGAEKITLFIQGSYANNTCVRGESDVDIAVVREDLFDRTFGSRFNPVIYNNRHLGKDFKDTVERELRIHFPGYVHRKNKSIKVDENTYRKPADTVPSFSLHYFNKSETGNYLDYLDGITIYADDGTIINNFPKQHIINGKQKNAQTKYYYKKMVRIIKKMRHLMLDLGYSSANNVSSFGLESLLWNIPNEVFTKYYSLGFVFSEVIDYLYKNKSSFISYKEANGIKPLCPTELEIANYKAFVDSLKQFYKYDY